MKLIDLLVKELPKRGGWPEGVDAVEQNSEGQLFEMESDYCSDFKLEKCDDWIADVVTKQQYESALAASKAVVGHDEWIQWAGGGCPVDSDAIVEVKFRNPSRNKFNNGRAGDFYWSHHGFDSDIIAYRLHQPGIDSRANDDHLEQDLNEFIGQDGGAPCSDASFPPEGIEIEYSTHGQEAWYRGIVTACGESMCIVKNLSGAEQAFHKFDIEFRPLRTEAEKLRDEITNAIASALFKDGDFDTKESLRLATFVYGDISAGKIPCVKLEVK